VLSTISRATRPVHCCLVRSRLWMPLKGHATYPGGRGFGPLKFCVGHEWGGLCWKSWKYRPASQPLCSIRVLTQSLRSAALAGMAFGQDFFRCCCLKKPRPGFKGAPPQDRTQWIPEPDAIEVPVLRCRHGRERQNRLHRCFVSTARGLVWQYSTIRIGRYFAVRLLCLIQRAAAPSPNTAAPRPRRGSTIGTAAVAGVL
jgi:hypothetical protein